MHAQQKYSTSKRNLRAMMLMTGLTLVIVGGLVLSRQAAPTAALPAAPAAITTPVGIALPAQARPATSNRIFQDEINAAAVVDLGDQTRQDAAWPESRHDLPRPMAEPLAPATRAPRSATNNRIFLDEIAGAQAMSLDALLLEPAALAAQHGPR
jgi:hypothetical protein